LRRGLAAGRFAFAADPEALDAFLADHELAPAVAALRAPLLLLHAEGDEQVPIQHSRELAAAVTAPGSRLIAVPGGHHRSIQHDAELQAVSLRFLGQVGGEPGAGVGDHDVDSAVLVRDSRRRAGDRARVGDVERPALDAGGGRGRTGGPRSSLGHPGLVPPREQDQVFRAPPGG